MSGSDVQLGTNERKSVLSSRDRFLCFCNEVTAETFRRVALAQTTGDLTSVCAAAGCADKCTACLYNCEALFYEILDAPRRMRKMSKRWRRGRGGCHFAVAFGSCWIGTRLACQCRFASLSRCWLVRALPPSPRWQTSFRVKSDPRLVVGTFPGSCAPAMAR